jgi:glycosyltransferase involved in cell wall biosynthesis
LVQQGDGRGGGDVLVSSAHSVLKYALPETKATARRKLKSRESRVMKLDLKGLRIGFISTRIAGTDGVSLEIEKWAHVLERMGLECYYIAGECDRPDDRTRLIPEAHFNHPEILSVSERAFSTEIRPKDLTTDIMRLTGSIRDQLNAAVEDLKLHALIVENALTIPMNLPLGIAIVQVAQEQRVGCLVHHHDFYWERDRFLVNSVNDLLRYAFPPALPQMNHIVINSPQSEEFSRRTGLSCRIIPNVMDFANPPSPADDYAAQFRKAVGMKEDDILILQPTRVVARKGIESAIELVRRLEMPHAKLVISHKSGDEGDLYVQRIEEYAKLLNVELLFVADWIAAERGQGADGRPLFTLGDVFTQADLVTYPSEYEGFGNAFLEAIYHKRPVVCNRYTIYRTDIEPCGFRTVVFDGFITDETVKETRRVLADKEWRQEMVDHNYDVAQEYFSYEILEAELRLIAERPHNIYRLLPRRKPRNH